MKSKSQLGRFLRVRRPQLQSSDVGLREFDGRRRVPGLRRGELARLAGVSESYYTRLEQGQLLNASTEVFDALARALRLDAIERRHLYGHCARPTQRRTDGEPHRACALRRAPRPEEPRGPARRPDTARLVFRDAHTRELYEDWPKMA
ncbi:helix-turn-helix domain-containing protein [Streptacidiphilus sp. EB129]|uniref:helix-turn-helix domain-containing protein n=1 Tax=Streptacidiphilus sp. EB129 TaxID=3156262 RepID=UPI0035172668